MSKKSPIPAVAYLRCSTDKQSDASIPDQRKHVTAYAAKHGYRIIREYTDEGISGDATERRHGFLRMRSDATEVGDFAAILCWDADRFGRFDSIEAGHWIFPLRPAGIQLVTVNDGVVDWETSIGRTLSALKQEGKHEFLRDLSRNVLRGAVEAARNGSWIGAAPYGYVVVGARKSKRLELGDPRHVETVQRIYRSYVDEGRSLAEVARHLNDDNIPSPRGSIWRSDVIRDLLRNPVYIGTFMWNRTSESKYSHVAEGEIRKGGRPGANDEADWIVNEDAHPAIVDPRVYELANARLDKGKTGQVRYSPDESPYVFSGKLVCGLCGSTMHGESRNPVTYTCKRARHGRDECEGARVKQTDLIEQLVDQIRTHLIGDELTDVLDAKAREGELSEDDLPEAYSLLRRAFVGNRKPKVDRRRLEQTLAKLTATVERARSNLVLLEPDEIPAARERISDLQDERDELESRLAEEPTEEGIAATVRSVLSKLYRLGATSPEGIREVLREVESVTVFTDRRGTGNAARYSLRRVQVRLQGSTTPLFYRAGQIRNRSKRRVGAKKGGGTPARGRDHRERTPGDVRRHRSTPKGLHSPFGARHCTTPLGQPFQGAGQVS